MDKSYYAIIPANVRYDNSLNANAKLLYGEITALTNKNGLCWATNEYFSDLYGVSERTITDWIKQLKEKGYIDFVIQTKRYDDGTVKKVRFISINHIEEWVLNHIEDLCKNHIEENFRYNNTIYNNTIYNITSNKKEKINKKEKSFEVDPFACFESQR